MPQRENNTGFLTLPRTILLQAKIRLHFLKFAGEAPTGRMKQEMTEEYSTVLVKRLMPSTQQTEKKFLHLEIMDLSISLKILIGIQWGKHTYQALRQELYTKIS